MDNANLHLAPIPKRLSQTQGTFDPSGKQYIQLQTSEPQHLIAAAKQAGLGLEITASPKVPREQVALRITLDESANLPAQGYRLTIQPLIIEITAADPAGAFYGACTLKQIIRQSGDKLPCLDIQDWPDLPNRGVMLDISRDKVPTMESLYRLVDMLAEWKINQFQLYTEHTFTYPAHPTVWEQASPMTGEQILELDKYCQERFVELVANQNSFGHLERWFKHEQYRSMAEAPDGSNTSWGIWFPAFSLCPQDERSLPFLDGLYDELLPHFSSRQFNVGCDETVDLGYGRSEQICKERGTGRVYMDFLMQIYGLVKKHGRKMMFWGDIILHHPELISELPEDVIALNWGYEANHPFAEQTKQFADSGIPFYVCPGTSAWGSLSGQTEKAIVNISSAAQNGLKNGAIGMLNTSWGDNGHWNPNSVEYLGFLTGAMLSWNADAEIRPDLAENLSLHAFQDTTFTTGRSIHDLGNLYQVFEKYTFNCSVPYQMLFHPTPDTEIIKDLKIEEFEEMERRLDEIEANFANEAMTIPDADTVRREIAFLVHLLRLSAEIGKLRLAAGESAITITDDLKNKIDQIKQEHKEVWLLRNRPGGLEDSVGKMKV